MKNTEELSGLLESVLASQRFAVLATQSDGQPYNNLIAFAEAEKLSRLIFVTDRNTRKYSNAQLNKKVAVLVDSRTNQTSDLQNAIAITALGTAGEVAQSNRDYLSEIYLLKHPQLADFLHKPSSALMEILITEYIVATFEGATSISVGETK